MAYTRNASDVMVSVMMSIDIMAMEACDWDGTGILNGDSIAHLLKGFGIDWEVDETDVRDFARLIPSGYEVNDVDDWDIYIVSPDRVRDLEENPRY